MNPSSASLPATRRTRAASLASLTSSPHPAPASATPALPRPPCTLEYLTVAPLRDRLPAVAPAVARWRRLALDARLPALLGHLLQRPAPRLDLAVVKARYLLQWVCAHGQFELGVDAPHWPALRVMLQARDPALANAMVASLFGSAWQPLRALLPGLHLARVSEAPQAGLKGPAWQGERCALVLHTMDAPLARWLEEALARQALPPDEAWLRLRLPARIELARRALPLHLLRTVSAGCCFVLGPCPDGSCTHALRAGVGRVWQAAVHFNLQEPHVSLATDPRLSGESADAIEHPAAALRLDDVQLPVAFELDTARISLAELGSMRAGQLVPLDAPAAEAAVRLVCCGQTVGQGQLVAIGDQLGVRILRMGLPA